VLVMLEAKRAWMVHAWCLASLYMRVRRVLGAMLACRKREKGADDLHANDTNTVA
jgi:hypothetical protein